jgi:hypothetical protein
VYVPVKAALPLQLLAVIAPVPIVAVNVPPKFIFSVKRTVMFPFKKLCPVTLGPLLPLTIRSLSCTDAVSTGWLKFTSKL